MNDVWSDVRHISKKDFKISQIVSESKGQWNIPLFPSQGIFQ